MSLEMESEGVSIPSASLAIITEKLDHISRQLDRVVYKDIYEEQRDRLKQDVEELRSVLEEEKALRSKIAFTAFSAIFALGIAVLNNAVTLFN